MDFNPDAPQSQQGSPVRPSTAAARAGAKDDDACAVRVAVHIRPLVENELAKGCQEILDVTPKTPQISVGSHRFTYDNVYGSGGGDSAENLYPDCVQPLVDGLFKGYNATVFAYGQTGSGKTYTMGSAWSPDEDNQGVIPSVMDELFTRVEHEPHTGFTIKVSFVEIHKEEVRDLLWANSSAPRPVVTIRELPTGVSLAGACERAVSSREDMSHVLMQGTLMRAVAATNMNSRSSRSHAIFTITVEQRRRQMVRPASAPPAVESTPRRSGLQDGDSSSSSDEVDDSAEDDEEEVEVGDEYLIAKMHLVDLAGSERAKRTGAEGARLKEAININKGLLALAKVITALVEGQSHVPYRDSKLTRLLQDSLGGNSRTVMIACVSPADINREESLNTLRYADRARRIKNKPVVNRDPMAAQLSALRQQIASLRAENLALRTALGGDKEAAGVIAAAGRGTNVASAALQEAYDDLAVRFNQLELENAKQQMQLESNQEEMKLLRSGLLTAETHRDQLLLRLQALQSAASASSDIAMKEALAQDTQAAAAAAEGPPSSPTAAARAAAEAAGSATGAAGAEAPAAGLLAEVGVVQSLRARVAELETELRQVRSLQRMASSVFVRGISSSLCSSSLTTRGLSSRQNSSSGGFAAMAGHGHVGRAASRLAGHHIGDISENGGALSGIFSDDGHGMGADLSPITPARPSGMCGGDLLGEPLMEVAPDAEILAQSAAHMMAREELALRLEVLGRQMEAKQKRLLALQSAADIETGMQGAKSKYMQELQKERDTLAKEKTVLLQKLAAVTQAGAEERKRLEQTYKDKLTSVEKRLRDLAEREKAAKRNAAQLGRVQSVCQQLQADIMRMKSQRAAVQRRMEAKEKEFREWRLTREREVIQLRRNAQRQNAALQQHQAMHSKQQAVLKRKTEEAEAARRKLRELTELQARVRRDKQAMHAATAGDGSGAAGADLELQPNASAPLLRTSKARREWIDQEMELCSTSWQYQKVLEGELAQRADATRKLREVQKQLMLLGGLVPPSPVVTAAAAAAARGRRHSNNLLSGPSGDGSGGMADEAVLTQDAKALQDAIDSHTKSIKELQEQWERARAEEQSRGAGAADVRRWTGIRNIVEAREMLRTLFISACTQRAQVCESQMELAKLQESNDIFEIRLDMAVQQAAEARRKALEAEATAAAVITTPAHFAAAVAAAGRGSSDGSDEEGGEAAAAAAGVAPDRGTPAPQQLQHQRSSRRLRQQELLSGGSTSSLDELAERRDPVDIEADSLLHSLGLPSIQEMPSPAEGCSTGGAEQQGVAGSSSDVAASVAEKLAARRERHWGRASSSSSRTSALLRAAAEGWPSQDGAEGQGRASGGVPSRRASAAAQELAAKLDALEGEWQGYKRTAAAAAASGTNRRSLSGGGNVWPGSRRSSSVPASPRCGGTGGSAAVGLHGGTPLGTPIGRHLQQQQQRERRVSLSANNSPMGRASDALAGQDGDAAAAGNAGTAQRSSSVQDGDPQQPNLLLRSISSIFKLGRDAVATIGMGSGARSPQVTESVVKSLDFHDVDDSRVGRSPAQTPSGTPRTSRRRSGSSKSPGTAGRAQQKNWQEQLRQQDQPGGAGCAGAPRAASAAAASRPRDSNSNQTDEEIFRLDSGDGEDDHSPAAGHHRSRARAIPDGSGHDDGDSDEFEDAEDDVNDEDDEEEDPSYDPAVHATPAAARRSSRQSGRHGRSRAARGSVSSEHDAASGGGNTSRASRRSSSHQQQQQLSCAGTGAGAGATAAAMARNLAAQVSFNHEKRQGWERPVLDDINNRRAGQGLAAVDKLTIQLLKENLVGQELDGKPWAPGNKTKDILIADYRRVLQLSDRDEDVTSINRITGAANWPMPGSLPSSLPSSPQPGSWAAAARRGADAEAAAVAEGVHSRPGSAAAGARHVLSHSLPPSPSGRDPYRAAIVGGSPLRAFQQHSRIPAVSAGGSSSRPQLSPTGRIDAGSPPFPGGSRAGSPQECGSPPLGPSPTRGSFQRMSPCPRVVHEQWGTAGGDSPRAGGQGGHRGFRACRMTFVSQSVDGSLMQAGAAREQQAQMAALQQAPQRTLRSNSSGNSTAPGSAAKLRVIIPQTTRVDGPFSNRVQQPATAGSNPTSSSERLRSANGQPNWR